MLRGGKAVERFLSGDEMQIKTPKCVSLNIGGALATWRISGDLSGSAGVRCQENFLQKTAKAHKRGNFEA